MNTCQQRKCVFWDYGNQICTDETEWVRPDTGAAVCRYWYGGILKEEYKKGE